MTIYLYNLMHTITQYGLILCDQCCFLYDITFRSLANNKLVSLPNGGDFQDLSVGNDLNLANNRITELPEKVFRDLSVSNDM